MILHKKIHFRKATLNILSFTNNIKLIFILKKFSFKVTVAINQKHFQILNSSKNQTMFT
jgi:hypothetical protein